MLLKRSTISIGTVFDVCKLMYCFRASSNQDCRPLLSRFFSIHHMFYFCRHIRRNRSFTCAFFINHVSMVCSCNIIMIISLKLIWSLLTGTFDHLYKGVFARHPHVLPVEENSDVGFGEAFLKSINIIYGAVSPGGSICFCVDDLIFFDDINLRYSYTNSYEHSAFMPNVILNIIALTIIRFFKSSFSFYAAVLVDQGKPYRFHFQICKSYHLTMTRHITFWLQSD